MKKIKHSIFVLAIVLSGLFLFAGGVLQTDAPGVRLRAAIEKEEVEGDLQAAIEQYKQIVLDSDDNRAIAASALLRLGGCYEKLGRDEAQKTYERLVRDYADQTKQAGAAQSRLAALREDSASRNEPVFTTRQVWTGGEMDWGGAPSPDGRYLSFTDWDTGDLSIRDLEKGINQRLTDKGPWEKSEEYVQFSRWSPDGKRIAYDWDDGKGSMDLHVISLDEKKPQILLDNENGEYFQLFDWSPDSRQILIFLRKANGTRQIMLVSAGNGATTVLKTFEGRGPRPGIMRFSRDGLYIAYDWPQDNDSPELDIFLLSLDGSREIPLIRHPANDRLLGWPPDGKGILFATDRTGSMEMWFLPVSEGKVQRQPEFVKSGATQIVPMGFSRNGAFYYGQNVERLDAYVATMDPESGRILLPPENAIQSFEGTNSWPDYSFDGKYLSYLTTRSRSLSIRRPNILCIRSLETGRERQFITTFKRLAGTRWSPDGRSLYVAAWDDEGQGIYRVDAQSGQFTVVISDEEERLYRHEVSPDGNTLIYGMQVRQGEGSFQVISRDLATGEERQLYTGERTMFSISPDGRLLALINSSKELILQVMSVSGGNPKEILKVEDSSLIRVIDWTADGQYIIFSRRAGNKGPQGLWRISADGGEPKELHLNMIAYEDLSVHPDGQHLVFDAFSSGATPPAIWVMENFLPESIQEKGRVQ